VVPGAAPGRGGFSAFRLDMAPIRELLWPDRVVPLAVRTVDTSDADYRPLPDWSRPFVLADDAAACGMPDEGPIGVPALPRVADRSWDDLLRRLDAMEFFGCAEPGLPTELAATTGGIASFYELCGHLGDYPTLRPWSADGEDWPRSGW